MAGSKSGSVQYELIMIYGFCTSIRKNIAAQIHSFGHCGRNSSVRPMSENPKRRQIDI